MANDNKKEILIIDDSVESIKVLVGLLNNDYKVYFAKDGLKGIEVAKSKKPDLILLDIIMPGIDGYEVCKRLKLDSITTDIPVIFITAVSEAMDEAKAFEFGGADYITKPYVPIIVKARIMNHLKLAEAMSELKRMYQLALDANPITGMPGNNSIQKFIEKALAENKKYYVLYADLDNFKSYNDKYGFANGDKVIAYTANLFHEIKKQTRCPEMFLGHVGGDDFVLVICENHALNYVTSFIEAFDQGIKEFYTAADLKQGYIVSKNREGKTVKYPIVSISIAGVNLSNGVYSSYLHINDICAELKAKAKKVTGSHYEIDNRENI